MDTIDELWERIETWMQRQAPQLLHQLAPGVTEEAIKRLEDRLNTQLSEEVRACYRRHDGGYKIVVEGSRRMLTLADILDTWQMLMECLEDEEWAATPPYYFSEEAFRLGVHPGPVQQVWWHPRWIPLATANAGNLTCLDLVPAPGGVVGQMLDWDHECGPSCMDFPSFHHLLSDFVDQLEGLADG